MTSVDGLITGLDTTAIIDSLMAAERIPQNQLFVQQATAQARSDSFAEIRTRYDAVRAAALELDLPTDWQQLSATSSSELVDVSAGTGVVTGSLRFSVVQRASAHAVYSTDTLSSLDDVVAAGGSVFSARDFAALGFSDLDGSGLAVGAQTFEVTQATNAAVKVGDTALAENVTIDGTNDTLTFSVNGTAHSVTIDHATYATRDDLVAAVRTSLDDVIGLDDDVTVNLNPVDQIELVTIREGSEATVQVTGGTALTDLGLSVDASAITGTDGTVSVNGNDTTITNTDTGTQVVLAAGTGTITATISGGLQLGTADVEQVSFGNGTLEDVVNAINGAGNTGTLASIIQVDTDQYRLQLISAETGDGAAIDVDLAQFTGLASGFTTLSAGQDAQLQIEGTAPFTVSSSTDTFTDLMPGVDVTLTGVPAGDVTIDVNRDADAIADRVETLVNALNEVLAGMDEVSAYDAETNRASVLTGNSTIRRARDELTAAVINQVSGASLATVGLTGVSIENDGSFTFDRTEFLDAYAADPAAVQRVYSVPFGSTDDSVVGRLVTEVDDAVAFGTGYLRTAEEAEDARVEDLNDQISSWDRRLELREGILRATYTRLETMLAELQSQSTWLAGQIATLSTPSSSAS